MAGTDVTRIYERCLVETKCSQLVYIGLFMLWYGTKMFHVVLSNTYV